MPKILKEREFEFLVLLLRQIILTGLDVSHNQNQLMFGASLVTASYSLGVDDYVRKLLSRNGFINGHPGQIEINGEELLLIVYLYQNGDGETLKCRFKGRSVTAYQWYVNRINEFLQRRCRLAPNPLRAENED